MQLIPTFYILSNESLVRYYAKQDGCAHVKLRHRIRAALVTINFYISIEKIKQKKRIFSHYILKLV